MNSQRMTKISKFLSLVLRHEPQKIGITLDEAGWVGVRTLLDALAKSGLPVLETELQEVVDASDKKRFALSEDRQEMLFHGTVDQLLDSIRKQGLLKGERHHVHLSRDAPTAMKVGQRRGRPVLLEVRSGAMHRDGIVFFVSANGVWLTEHVPPNYIEFPKDQQ
jgi:putative RNA 2'-phosphotransferase